MKEKKEAVHVEKWIVILVCVAMPLSGLIGLVKSMLFYIALVLISTDWNEGESIDWLASETMNSLDPLFLGAIAIIAGFSAILLLAGIVTIPVAIKYLKKK